VRPAAMGNPAPGAEQGRGAPHQHGGRWADPKRHAGYRASQRPYRACLERGLGPTGLPIQAPDNVEQVCDRPGPDPANDPMRYISASWIAAGLTGAFDQMAQSIAGYEASAEIHEIYLEVRAVPRARHSFTPRSRWATDLFRGRRSATPPRDGGPG